MNESNLFAYEKPEPDFRIPFRVVPSWNDILTSVSAGGGKFNTIAADVKKWRARARERAVAVFKEQGFPIVTIRRELHSTDKRTGLKKQEFFEGLEKPFFDEPVACLVRLWRPNQADFDIHNLFIKPIFDGFADVRLYENDAVRGFPEMAFIFEGVDTSLKLTEKEQAERKAYLDRWRKRDKNPPRLPLPARVWFDFYALSKLQFGTIYQFAKS